MKLSLLDFGYVPPAAKPSRVLRDLVASAPIAEKLGFYRFWLAEHHEAHFSYSCPELLIPQIAASTSSIRVGTAGVLMHFHSPLKIAETFRMLEALYPGRVDLGVASGLSGSDQIRHALRHGFDLAQAVRTRLYTSQVEELLGWCRNTIEGHQATPRGQASPPVLLMGGGRGIGNMTMAARHGTAFCYSISHGSSETGPEIVARYRAEFQPSAELPTPQTAIAGTLICAETNSEALGVQNYFLALDKGLKAAVIGRPERCRAVIQELLDRYGCDEFIAMPMATNQDEKLRSYRLLSETCQLTCPTGTTPHPPADTDGKPGARNTV
ncbi:MAG: MsnO8 family LLM class oxidoreductase [Bryobacteraceae bacterium]